MQQSRVDGRHSDHLQLPAQRVGFRPLVAPVLVLDDQGQRLGVVNEFQQGGHCGVLDVVVPGQAAQCHQRPQPQWQAVHVTICGQAKTLKKKKCSGQT